MNAGTDFRVVLRQTLRQHSLALLEREMLPSPDMPFCFSEAPRYGLPRSDGVHLGREPHAFPRLNERHGNGYRAADSTGSADLF